MKPLSINTVTVVIFYQDFKEIARLGLRGYEPDWSLPRYEFARFDYSHADNFYNGEQICEEMWHTFNAPNEMLSSYQQALTQVFKGRSLSIGDVVQVGSVKYLCSNVGWKKEENI